MKTVNLEATKEKICEYLDELNSKDWVELHNNLCSWYGQDCFIYPSNDFKNDRVLESIKKDFDMFFKLDVNSIYFNKHHKFYCKNRFLKIKGYYISFDNPKEIIKYIKIDIYIEYVLNILLVSWHNGFTSPEYIPKSLKLVFD